MNDKRLRRLLLRAGKELAKQSKTYPVLREPGLSPISAVVYFKGRSGVEYQVDMRVSLSDLLASKERR